MPPVKMYALSKEGYIVHPYIGYLTKLSRIQIFENLMWALRVFQALKTDT